MIRNCRGISDITGAESYILTLLSGLQRAGCAVELLCAIREDAGETQWLRTLRSRDIPFHLVDVPSTFSLADLRALKGRLEAFQPDVIHAMDHRSDAIAVLAARRKSIPAVASFFGWTNWQDTSWRGYIYPTVDRLLMRNLKRVIVDSHHIGDQIRAPEGHVAVIPNGVDTNRFDPDKTPAPYKQTWFGRDDITLVGTVGRVHPNKGHLELADAAARLLKTNPNTRFAIIGEPPPGFEDYGAELRQKITDTGMGDQFLVTNIPSSEIPKAIASFDITVLPSYLESLSYVMLESMAMKTPVISSRVGGHGELIESGRNGILIEAGDVDALVQSLESLIGDPTLRHQIGLAGHETMMARYSVDSMVARTIEVYEEAIAQ